MRRLGIVAIMIAISALSFAVGGWLGGGRAASDDGRRVLYYVDPMNPGFRSDEPGVAPCGMPLEAVYEERGEAAATLPPGVVKVSPARQQLIGVKVAPAAITPVTHTLRLYGKVVPDETRLYRLNASTDSWIRQISDVTTGSIVHKGQILAEALAPTYYDAQLTYLIALDNLDRVRRQQGGELRRQQGNLADNQIRVAVQDLQHLGIGDDQIEELANTRQARSFLQVRAPSRGVVLSRNVTLSQWFRASEEFFTIADIGRVWVYADVYEDEARHLRPGMKVKVTHAQIGRDFQARISRALPLFDPISKTLKVRIDVDNPGYDLRPDMFVDVEIPLTMPPSLNVPADAVIDSGTKSVVYVDIGHDTFEPREVETGWRLGRRVEITGGLMPEEKVVASGNFLIDSESRMRTAAFSDEATSGKDPVCGMYVDRLEAETSGWTAMHSGSAYYFCSSRCAQAFTEEPDKFVDGAPAHARTSMKEMESGWLDAQKTPKMDHMKSVAEETLIKSAIAGTTVNRDGPGEEGAPASNWRGGGKVPGAMHIGQHDDMKKMPEAHDRHEAQREDTAASAPADAQGVEIKHEAHEGTQSGQTPPVEQ